MIIISDLNAEVENRRQGRVLGIVGLGKNIYDPVFQDRMNMNTWFRQRPRLWTCKSLGDRYKNKTDYITKN